MWPVRTIDVEMEGEWGALEDSEGIVYIKRNRIEKDESPGRIPDRKKENGSSLNKDDDEEEEEYKNNFYRGTYEKNC